MPGTESTQPSPTSPNPLTDPNNRQSPSGNLSRHRPNPLRAIEVFGDFTEELSHKLLSQISIYRHESNAPITVYINSLGGSVPVLKFINGFLDTRDIDNKWCHTITVAIGNAASAGANLLAFGDYALAYEHSYIHFHGVRTSDLPEKFEDAVQLTTELERIQRDVARKLSQSIISRVLFRYQKLKEDFNCKRKDIPDRALIELRCFADAIGREISPRARNLVEKTFRNVQQARALTGKIMPKVRPVKSGNLAKQDARVLIGVIRHELDGKSKSWRIDERGIQRILNDYFVIRDYNIDEHWRFFSTVVNVFGPDFLTAGEAKQYRKLESTDTKKARDFLRQKAFPRMEPLWYYTVSLCRALFEGENRLSPSDAYWLGIIDEVVGTNLTGFRIVAEQQKAKQQKPETTSFSTSQSPPAAQSPSSD